MEYAYFIGVLIGFIIWLIFFILRKDLRKEILFGGLLAAPFGFSGSLFIPEYWDPITLFDLANKAKFTIEGILFCFSFGGIAAVIFEVFFRKKLVKIKSDHKTHILPYFSFIIMIIVLEFIFPDKSIYNASIAPILLAIFIGIKRRDLITQMLFGGIAFTLLYLLFFIIFNAIFPGYVENVYTLNNLLGINILGTPIEEFIFAFAAGGCWSAFYEYVKGYKTKNLNN